MADLRTMLMMQLNPIICVIQGCKRVIGRVALLSNIVVSEWPMSSSYRILRGSISEQRIKNIAVAQQFNMSNHGDKREVLSRVLYHLFLLLGRLFDGGLEMNCLNISRVEENAQGPLSFLRSLAFVEVPQ